MGYARGAEAKEFCHRHHEDKSFRCSYNLYGPHAAGVLCRAWCHRAQFYLDQEAMDPMGKGVTFEQRHHDRYEEPAELLSLLALPDVSEAVRARVAQLREIFVL
eukprot:836926-Lingulodinium_polyedra.AAC.1